MTEEQRRRAIVVSSCTHAIRDSDHPVSLTCGASGPWDLVCHAEERQNVELTIWCSGVGRRVRFDGGDKSLRPSRVTGQKESCASCAAAKDFRSVGKQFHFLLR